MATVQAGDFYPGSYQVLTKIAAVSLVTAAIYPGFTATAGRPDVVFWVIFDNFSAFAPGQALPGTVAWNMGSDAARTNMVASTTFAGVVPYVFPVWTPALDRSPYLVAGFSLAFQINTGLANAGTADVTILGRSL